MFSLVGKHRAEICRTAMPIDKASSGANLFKLFRGDYIDTLRLLPLHVLQEPRDRVVEDHRSVFDFFHSLKMQFTESLRHGLQGKAAVSQRDYSASREA